jgi:hypothetical protein
MASIFGDLINDANECNSFAHLQDDPVARNANFAEWASRLARIDVADSDRSDELCAALTGSESPWTLQQKSELSRLISAIGGRNGVNRGRMQKAVNFENMLSETDWAKMRKNVFEHAGIALLAQRAASLNIKNASEPTLFRMCDILAYCMEKPAFDQTKKFSIKVSLQGAIKSEHARITATHHSLPWITEYPFSASELPPALIELAYEGNGPPFHLGVLLAQEEDLLLVQEEDLLLAQEEDLLLVQEEDLILLQEEEDLLLAQEEDLLLAQEEDLLLAQEEDLLFSQEEDLLLAQEEDLLYSSSCTRR